MSKRKSISNSVRFEVFKRDSFTCQYCGSKAPEVVLNVDHISPVASGGDNNITNLVTSCFSCNSGKSDKVLSDKTAIAKQQAQLEALNERRQQLEMMVQWRKGLLGIEDDAVSEIAALVEQLSGSGVNDVGLKKIRLWLKKFSASDLSEATKRAFATYAKFDANGNFEDESWERAFKKIPVIAGHIKNGSMPEELLMGYYVAAVFFNKRLISQADKPGIAQMVSALICSGVGAEEVKGMAKSTNDLRVFWELAVNSVKDFEKFERLISEVKARERLEAGKIAA